MGQERATSLLVRAGTGNRHLTTNTYTCEAIRFVLSDAYTSMSREERQSLLHEGVSVATTLSAYGTPSNPSQYH